MLIGIRYFLLKKANNWKKSLSESLKKRWFSWMFMLCSIVSRTDPDILEQWSDTRSRFVSRSDHTNPAATEQSPFWSRTLVHFGNCDTQGYHVEVSPLLSRKAEAFSDDIVFSNLSITQLSEFYVLSVSDEQRAVERVIIIPTTGLP